MFVEEPYKINSAELDGNVGICDGGDLSSTHDEPVRKGNADDGSVKQVHELAILYIKSWPREFRKPRDALDEKTFWVRRLPQLKILLHLVVWKWAGAHKPRWLRSEYHAQFLSPEKEEEKSWQQWLRALFSTVIFAVMDKKRFVNRKERYWKWRKPSRDRGK